jgi:hypothetical protein
MPLPCSASSTLPRIYYKTEDLAAPDLKANVPGKFKTGITDKSKGPKACHIPVTKTDALKDALISIG